MLCTYTIYKEGESVYGRKRRETREKFVAEVESGTYVKPSKMTLSDFVSEWGKHYAEKQLAPRNYKVALETGRGKGE
ncbi:hypothetical protein ADA01nite_29340 [Aneurinibacillus danicus]|uniref:AP2-like integrase N-terminal domain-containing protein n=1 Tax=Aneurinibacillus danicus TaxID=267746 RepID=A0A511V956_9BACL|nr:hypothetical protein ADA01nite_29340 [Aneurinibacillus danicus]